MKILKDLLYTEEHEWVSVEEDVATIGITDYAQGELGDVVFVELPAVGTEVKQMESFGTIEAVKAVSDLFAPVSGQVVEINEALADQPELVNKDPFVDGWMIKIKMSDSSELESLLKADTYKSMIS
ncbi:MAG TPA: glycine cleavage system protein GcvH [bacterium]|nr:glycine cleavage system protein GcvH [bacterium]HPN33482.1 glycine cleavage system protein GcvH [bacterium]